MDIVDTHLHVINMETLSYPWIETLEPLRRNYLYSTYAREARRCGIVSVLHMEVDVYAADIEAESAMVTELRNAPGSLIKGAISSCRPESQDFPAFLERQRTNPIVKGFRRVLHVVPDGVSESTLFRQNIKRLGGTGLPFDLCVLPHQIPLAIALADTAPDVQFILDHCGVPGVKDKALRPWLEHISEFSKRPNVAVKVSGISAYGDADTWTVDDLRPYVEHVINAFGWNRVVWGSDWPVVTLGSSLSTWVAATHALINGSSVDEKIALWSGNAKRIWKL